jgi:cysteine synthase
MRALGAELDLVPSVEGPPKVTPQDITNMVARASELAAQPGHDATDQFNNPYIIPDHHDHHRGPRHRVLLGRASTRCWR